MALTFAQAKDQFEAYAGYTTAAEAQLFVQACARLIVEGQSLSAGGRTYTREAVQSELDKARDFLRSARTARPALFSRGVPSGLGR